ncbi:unnamed protein product [Angiostrongylus costaricensis]|uniref:Endo/exonuclease/phosphatase domain-containing protein n=1 Tax=Angiostrongylus costaricensis TaxID=334426 RepID=A0A0R3PVN6_ANGCS|nr:unnamed protein product [Angiostrongylus costaricensis]
MHACVGAFLLMWIVFYESIRPKACSQLTGKYMRGEPIKLHVGIKNSKQSEKKGSHFPDPERAPNFAALGRTSTVFLLKSQGQWKLPGFQGTIVKICTYNERTLASEFSIEDLLMQARRKKYLVIGLSETRRRRPIHTVYDTGEGLFLGTCDSTEVGGVGVLINMSLPMNIDSFEQLTTRIGRLRLRRRGSIPALTIFVVYAPTSNYDEKEFEAFYMDLEKFYREDHTFFKVIIGDFNAKIGPRKTSEERHIAWAHGLEWNEHGHIAIIKANQEIMLDGSKPIGALDKRETLNENASFKHYATRLRLRLKRRGSISALIIFVVYTPTSNYDEEEVEAFYMDLEKFYREDHTFFKVIIGSFNDKIGPRRTPEERHIGTHGLEWNEQGERLSEFIIATKTIHGNLKFQKPHPLRWT